jgi:hypothetical protein
VQQNWPGTVRSSTGTNTVSSPQSAHAAVTPLSINRSEGRLAVLLDVVMWQP